jgi:hypothetical protein
MRRRLSCPCAQTPREMLRHRNQDGDRVFGLSRASNAARFRGRETAYESYAGKTVPRRNLPRRAE